MNTTIKKQAILQSLESMNAKEMDLVMSYIKDMLYNQQNDMSYLELKRRALSEIRDALRPKEKLTATVI